LARKDDIEVLAGQLVAQNMMIQMLIGIRPCTGRTRVKAMYVAFV
jgi:hypothetical protein